MMHLLRLALASLLNRKVTVLLVLLSIALSVGLTFGVERIRQDVRDGFAQSLSGTDLVVGARSGPLNLLLYSVFGVGDATNDMSVEAYKAIATHSAVAWSVPLMMGDSLQGFRVVGTEPAYFEHYQYGAVVDGQRSKLKFVDGRSFDGIFELTLGAEVAQALKLKVGDTVGLTHGMSLQGLSHDDKPCRVVGVLARTGTPVDRTVLTSGQTIEAIHIDWVGGMPVPGFKVPPEHVKKFDIQPKRVTAALVGLKSRGQVFAMQRFVNNYEQEALTAIIPGLALQQLWQVTAIAEQALRAIAWMTVVVGLVGLCAVMLAGLNERRREMAVLRAVGARPWHIALLLWLEAIVIATLACIIGVGLVVVAVLVLGQWVQQETGVILSLSMPAPEQWLYFLGVIASAGLISLIPAWAAYRSSLADGLTVKL